MKQRIFTLLMMLALMVVAGSVMAQDSQHPIAGQKYHYQLNGINTNVSGTARITWTGLTATPIISGESLAGTYPNYIVPAGGVNFAFDVTYDKNESAGDKNLRVTVENGTGGCTNFIDLKVTVVIPTIALQITAATDIACQELKTPTNDNQDGSVGAAANTLVFTITPTTVPASLTGYSYNFHFNLDSWKFGATDLTVTSVTNGNATLSAPGYTITGTGTGVTTVTVSFATTTNQAQQDFAAVLTTPQLVIGTETYTVGCSITDPTSGANVSTITYTPSIGVFTF